MTLTFDADTHTYALDGVVVPSVSEVLAAAGLATDYSAIPAEVLEAARRRGGAVHRLCDQIDQGMDGVFPEEGLVPYVVAYQRFVNEAGYVSHSSEEAVYHPRARYAGTLDMRGHVAHRHAIIDRKSTTTIDHTAVAAQCGAYFAAHNSQHPDDMVEAIYSLHLRPDGTYRLTEYAPHPAANAFLHALEIYRWKKSRHKTRA